MTDQISVFLRDCHVQLRVGVHSHERHAPQTVLVNIDAQMALTGRFDNPAEKTTDRTVSYETLYNFVQNDLPRMGHVYLLESLAEAIADFCFRDARIGSVTVRLEKPDILAGANVGIAMTRTRPSGKA